MPKVKGARSVGVEPPSESVGCAVRGVWTQADGAPVAAQTLFFEPQRGGIWRGRVIDRAAFPVQTDAAGRFEVTLAPSVAVGLYTVKMGRLRMTVDVPEMAEAELSQIVL